MELNCRFQEDTYGLMPAAASLLLGSVTFGELELLRSLSERLGVSIIENEYSVFIQQIRRKINAGQYYPPLMAVLDNCPAEIFPNVGALLWVIIILPMTSCTVERLLSMTDQIKTRLRASMSTPRLKNFTFLSFERELSDSLD